MFLNNVMINFEIWSQGFKIWYQSISFFPPSSIRTLNSQPQTFASWLSSPALQSRSSCISSNRLADRIFMATPSTSQVYKLPFLFTCTYQFSHFHASNEIFLSEKLLHPRHYILCKCVYKSILHVHFRMLGHILTVILRISVIDNWGSSSLKIV